MTIILAPEYITTIILAIVTLGVAVPFMVKGYLDWRKEQARWKTFDAFYGSFQYCISDPSITPFDVTKLGKAFDHAIDCINVMGPWKKSLPVSNIRIFITTSDKWTAMNGQLVAGQQVGNLIHIGPRMQALCHEMIHVIEEVFDGVTDKDHVSWEARGLESADASFHGWLDAEFRTVKLTST